MNKFLIVSTFFMLFLHSVYAIDNYNGVYSDFADSVVNINNGAVLSSDLSAITLTRHTEINNSGTITANINMTDYSMSVRNNGVFSGHINIGSGQLVQIIKDNNDITRLNVDNISGSNYKLNITDAGESISLRSVMQLDATDAEITNSKILIDDFNDWRNLTFNVSLNNAELVIINPNTVISGEIISASGISGILKTSVYGTGNLYNVSTVESGGVYRIYLSRETNYEKIFNDKRGTLLKNIRDANSNDKLLKKMDGATSLSELNNIMNRSYRFNRDVLAKPVKTINKFSMINSVDDSDDFGGNIHYLMSNSISGFGGTVNINNSFDDFFIGLGFDFNEFSFEDDFNDFNGMVYGLNAKIAFDISSIKLKNKVGFNWISFDTEDLIVDDEIKNNPNGYSLYDVFDLEYENFVYGYLSVVPFVGLNIQKNKILDYDETDFGLHGGGNIKYDVVVDGVKYEYIAGGSVSTNTDIYATFKIGFVSISDNAGGAIGCDVIKDEEEIGYKLSLSGKIKF